MKYFKFVRHLDLKYFRVRLKPYVKVGCEKRKNGEPIPSNLASGAKTGKITLDVITIGKALGKRRPNNLKK